MSVLSRTVRRRWLMATALLGAAVVPVAAGSSTPVSAAGPSVFINEIHYDNTGGDVGEAIEIAAPAGTNLTGWDVVLYNGSTASSAVVYNTVNLIGTISDQASGFGTLTINLPANGLQNGSPDGLALVDAGGTVVEFLSYEGVMTAGSGPAAGMVSTDIGVSEPSSTPVGDSLQRTGNGSMAGDFTWAAAQPNTFGAPNTGQTFTGGSGPFPGDIVITEVMQNPAAVSDSTGEWFELQNVSGEDIDIEGWTISDRDSDSHTIANGAPLVIPAGGVAVLGNNADTLANGGVAVDYSYSGWFLSNSADEVVVTDPGGVEIDAIEYDGGPVWPDPTGASMSLDVSFTSAAANDDGANWCTAVTPYGDGDLGTPGAANPICEVAPPDTEFIHDIQGSGSSVAITQPVVVEAIVTSLFERDDQLDGFFVQEEDADADADPATSEGIFVFCRGNCPVPGDGVGEIAVGDAVSVTGTPTDFFGMSQIDMTDGAVTVNSSGNPLPTATAITLPASDSTLAEGTFESTEGMVVSFPDTLVVSEYFQLGRFGQIVLTESSRPFQFTHLNAPDVAGNAANAAELATRRIILDDNSNDNNDPIFDGADEAYYHPSGGLSTANKFRGGDTITGMTGVMHWSFAGSSGTDAWRVRPIDGVDYSFTSVNPEPASPADVGGTMQVASFNVLNYFTTIDTGPAACGPGGALGCRGANSVAELDRQRAKIVAAMLEIDADVVGLVELENDGDDASIADLVNALNAATAPGTYDYIATGFIGGDAIKVGLIYQPAAVSPAGDFAILDTSVDPTFIDTKNRPVLIQTFDENATGERFTVAVNHFKSKGSPCDDVGDPDLNDGQASCPNTRTAAATALANYLATDPTGSGDPDVLIIGDLNAYAMEDPITALEGAGYTDLNKLFHGSDAYSFVFDGQLGYLDYALASSSLVDRVTGVDEWHINADEINLFDYNDDIRDPGEASFERESTVGPLYAPDALRSSDHDPLVIGLDMATARSLKQKALDDLYELLPTPNWRDNWRIVKAIIAVKHTLADYRWVDDSNLDPWFGRSVFDGERRAARELQRLSGPVAEGAQAVIDLMIEADDRLANTALDAAIAGGGNPNKIARAQAELEKAADDIAVGRYDRAIAHYRRAWQHAIKALN